MQIGHKTFSQPKRDGPKRHEPPQKIFIFRKPYHLDDFQSGQFSRKPCPHLSLHRTVVVVKVKPKRIECNVFANNTVFSLGTTPQYRAMSIWIIQSGQKNTNYSQTKALQVTWIHGSGETLQNFNVHDTFEGGTVGRSSRQLWPFQCSRQIDHAVGAIEGQDLWGISSRRPTRLKSGGHTSGAGERGHDCAEVGKLGDNWATSHDPSLFQKQRVPHFRKPCPILSKKVVTSFHV